MSPKGNKHLFELDVACANNLTATFAPGIDHPLKVRMRQYDGLLKTGRNFQRCDVQTNSISEAEADAQFEAMQKMLKNNHF